MRIFWSHVDSLAMAMIQRRRLPEHGRSGNRSALPKTRARRDNICLIGTYLVPLGAPTLLTNS